MFSWKMRLLFDTPYGRGHTIGHPSDITGRFMVTVDSSQIGGAHYSMMAAIKPGMKLVGYAILPWFMQGILFH